MKALLYMLSSLCILAAAYFKIQGKEKIYLPLGDSYTIGTGVSINDSWPMQLKEKLQQRGTIYAIPVNPARNGFTTHDLIRNELPLLKKGPKPDLITLLIGVNDWVQGLDKESFRKNLVFIMEEMKEQLSPGGRIIVLTIPDFGKSPSGKKYARGRDISGGISEYNSVIRAEAEVRNFVLVDIFTLSQEMEKDTSLVAPDGLHPSAKEYSLWTEKIVKAMLSGGK